MTSRSRPSLSATTFKDRPLSAIFLGRAAASPHIGITPPSNLPDLPEPPSPGGSPSSPPSRLSGLPSPPATNSTGSSTGDNSTNAGSLRSRDRPASIQTTSNSTITKSRIESNMNNSPNSLHGYATSQSRSRDGDEENDNDENRAARHLRRSSRSIRSPSDNVPAIQRVKSLAQRNRDALTKLTRLSSPSPSPSPVPPPSNGRPRSPLLPSSSSLRLETASQALPARKTSEAQSGSETEREKHNGYSDDELDETVTTPISTSSAHTRSTSYANTRFSSSAYLPPSHQSLTRSSTSARSTLPSSHQRRASVTTSPDKPLPSVRRDGNAPRTPGKAAMNSAVLDHLFDRDAHRDRRGTSDVTSAALAAVASVRENMNISGSATWGRSSRVGEYRERNAGERRSLDIRPTSTAPSTPRRNRNDESDHNLSVPRDSPSPKSSGSLVSGESANGSVDAWGLMPRRTLRRRSGTIRVRSDNPEVGPSASSQEDRAAERRAPTRQDNLSIGGRLVGQGLKAAGILRKSSVDSHTLASGSGERTSEDVFSVEGGEQKRKNKFSSVLTSILGPKGKGKARRLPEDEEDVIGDDEAEIGWQSQASRRRPGMRSVSGPIASSAISSTLHTPARLHGASPEFESPSDYRERDREEGTARNLPQNQRSPTSITAHRSNSVSMHAQSDDEDVNPRSVSRNSRSPLPPGSAEREKARLESASRLSSQRDRDRYMSPTFTGSSTIGRHAAGTPVFHRTSPSPLPQGHTIHPEHGRLMTEALGLFESQLLRIPSTSAVSELFKSAQNVVFTTEKLNSLLRDGTNKALASHIDAEIKDEGDFDAEVWRKVGSEFRDTLRVSDDLVRTVTTFMLGMGKILREMSAGQTGYTHVRGLSSDLEDRGAGSADAGGSVRRSLDERRPLDGRRSVASQRSSEHSDPLRRLANRTGNSARPPSSLASLRDREMDRRGSVDDGSIPDHLPPTPPPASTSSRATPDSVPVRRHLRREQVENQNEDLRISVAESVETIRASDYMSSSERGRDSTQPPNSSPSAISQNQTDKSTRRRSNLIPVGHSRSGSSIPPTLNVVATSNPTTALSTQTASSPIIPVTRANSSSSSSRQKAVTFSRSSSASISALNGLQREDHRKRLASNASSSSVEPTATSQPAIQKSFSSSDAEHDVRRMPSTSRTRGSLDTERPSYTVVGPSSARRERRRTITDVFF